jgi:hypothetical protein
MLKIFLEAAKPEEVHREENRVLASGEKIYTQLS